jgi:hypothetical protein
MGKEKVDENIGLGFISIMYLIIRSLEFRSQSFQKTHYIYTFPIIIINAAKSFPSPLNQQCTHRIIPSQLQTAVKSGLTLVQTPEIR